MIAYLLNVILGSVLRPLKFTLSYPADFVTGGELVYGGHLSRPLPPTHRPRGHQGLGQHLL